MINKFTFRDPGLIGSLAGVVDCGDPPNLSDLGMWFDAARDATTSGSPSIDGDLVDSWLNQAGTVDATASGTGRPTYKTGIVNGLPVLRFNGTTTFMTIPDGADNDETTTFTFWCLINLASVAAYNMIVTKGSNAFAMQYEYRVAPTALNRFEMVGTFPNLLSGNPVIPASVWRRLVATKDSTNGGITYVDNVVSHNGGMVVTDTADNVFIGKRFDGLFLNGDIAEWGFYKTELDATARQALDDYLVCKYAL